MVSAIDPTKPADNVPAVKAHLRANLRAAKLEIESLQATKLQNGQAINMAGQQLTRPQLKDYRETIARPAVIAGTVTLDLRLGNVFEVTMTGNVMSLVFANTPATGLAASCTLFLKKDGRGGRKLSWPASIYWSRGERPPTSLGANAVDIFAFMTTNGGATWYGLCGGWDFRGQ
jgi:hypothetical protein